MTEAQLQRCILTYIRTVLPDALCVHIPNGGSRAGGAVEGARLKAQGVTAGFPDLLLMPGSGRAFVLEVKTPTGRVSPAQHALMDKLHHLGIEGAVVRSVNDVALALKAWGIQTRAVA